MKKLKQNLKFRGSMHLSQYKVFWKFKKWIKNRIFFIGSRMFRYKYNALNTKENISSFRDLLKVTQFQLFVAISFTALLQILDPKIRMFFGVLNEGIPENTSYVTFLTTISGIGGVFIGLYYAAISTVGSSMYAKVPNNVRDLLAQERIGNVYMHYLSFITFLGISLVAFRLIGFHRVYIAIPLMSIAAGVGIIAFVKLGQRAFYLFDPTSLSHLIFRQLRYLVNIVKAPGDTWDNEAFQRHANKISYKNLETLGTLSNITENEVHLREAPYISLCIEIIDFLIFYEKSKNKIPTSSLWYNDKYVHKDWYREADTRTSMAHETATALRPKVEKDYDWVENNTLPIVYECARINLTHENYDDVNILLNKLSEYLKILTKSGKSRNSFLILENISQKILSPVYDKPDEGVGNGQSIGKLGIVERLASIPIDLALSNSEYVNDLSVEKVKKQLHEIKWSDRESLYKSRFPSRDLQKVEWLYSRMKFEISAEGSVITPIWYQSDLVIQTESEYFVENVKFLIDEASRIYATWIKSAIDKKLPWLAAALMSREWEYWSKIERQFGEWRAKWRELSSVNMSTELPWPTLEFDGLKGTMTDRRSELIRSMSTQNLILSLSKRPSGFPDYAGQFLHTVGELLFGSIINNDSDLFKDAFPNYLYGCILRFDALRPESSEPSFRTQRDFKIASAPLLDLMDLSGYARLMADLHGNLQLWEEVCKAWDKYLEKRTNLLPLFAGVIQFCEDGLEVPHRGTLRSNWKMQIEDILKDVPTKNEQPLDPINIGVEINHPSPLVRLFARTPHGTLYNGLNIFSIFYLRHKSSPSDLDFGHKTKALNDELEREAED